MLRRCSALIAVFLLSGLLTRTGLATADAAPRAPKTLLPASASALPPASGPLAALLEHAEPTASADTPDWTDRIDARLVALAAEPRRSSEDAPSRRLREAVDAALGELDPRTRAAVEIRELGSAQVLAAHEPGRALNPASNQKLVSAIAAAELLGPDYRFQTSVLRRGDALILRGEGDPDLHVADLHALVDELLAEPGALEGVRRVLVDDHAFSDRRLGPGFSAEGCGDSYIAPSGALALDYATLEITLRPGRYRGPVEVEVSPTPAGLGEGERAEGIVELVNTARTESGRPRVCTEAGEGGRTRVRVEGALPAGHAPMTLRRRVADPGLLAGGVFAQLLAERSEGPALPVARAALPAQPGEDTRLLATHESAPLIAALASALRYSNNFTAEQVLRTLAWRASGRPGSWAEGARVLERFAAAVSVHAGDQRMINGSGLSREGRLTPRFVLDVLALCRRPGSPAALLLASFAEAGGEGTLRNRNPVAGPRLLAKTGTYAGASSLSGLVYDSTGARALSFSVLLNGGDLERNRAAQDRIVAAMLRALD
ncbi:D-alanyl-D-alanine carboxypeptidase/D-alanyl-D-alanine-endopeptidase [Pseudenhygromyxa sp. WMMC2535]|uniref:D-alanyl-D-alanine carboxypeptidase/D-alanyl-D-alanine endopeptidase n=1 Tax=Pseudenhygromyxa sp. WMMC2535 TaxID=2712867 RepID=UPI001553DAD8|nr:D-alanyl-D-alanine carboxypeptidase/D-alanyl-D-alanine-endopeptidase [Pseudenhygromyxa sp. WMMC2535]NVB40716.1 D-alanyl-D-alanine carboxypeptidase/D-alanyl-D-alanine-endopeptidase [Pseudenhygromyxa sp. WMMC2535]